MKKSEEDAHSAAEMDAIENNDPEFIFEKHIDLKEKQRNKLEKEYFDKMLFYLECEMSLLIYGVGSKRELMHNFL